MKYRVNATLVFNKSIFRVLHIFRNILQYIDFLMNTSTTKVKRQDYEKEESCM